MSTESPSSSCPRCGAPRAPAPECPRCGIYYAKAEARAAQAAATVAAPPAFLPLEPERPPHLPAEALTWNEDAEDAQLELKIRLFAIPAALLLTWVLHSTGMGHSLLRIFLSMWIHELGHAVTAWLTGYTAFPGPWATSIAEVRSPSFSVLLAAGLGALTYRGWKLRHRPTLIAGITLLCLQLVGTVLVRGGMARSFITFGGDGGCLVLGTLLMLTLYAGKDSSLHRGWLRWGFLVIGAAAFTDAFKVWWDSWRDRGEIPFGRIEGVGLSDASRLTEWFGWSADSLISRYLGLAWICLAVLAILYVAGVLRARAALRARPDGTG
ncbi:hypothetical protein [Hyalangium sp.]|uniref:hypothetical protein n=1 Tax=Hyalangium sp. TaxID=2028555 RepID=UPI002D74B110|nr:hypothetical protein [Hyalangium sp.]HYI01540.1 hypothetical protein [Hyalangium sp.]